MPEETVRGQVTTSKALASTPSNRTFLRFTLAALATVMGVVYVLIALQAVHVSETAGKSSPFVPMAAAGVAFFIGAALLILTDRRIVYLLGTAVQVLVLVGYFAVAPSRDPHYETIGLLMKVVQAVMLGLLLFLALESSGGLHRGARLGRAHRSRSA
jgi:hypothetical protein